jgi:tetratricopeptide (TPR) repeat protein
MKVMPTPEEFFLLSRITGTLTVADLCQVSGLSRQQTIDGLLRLNEAGLLDLPGHGPAPKADMSFGAEAVVGGPAVASEPVRPATPTKPAPAVSAAPAEAEGAEEEGGADVDPYRLYPVALSAFKPDAALMAEAVDLDDERKREVLYVYEHMERMDYYRFLGLERDADRKAVRASFFVLSKRFHPDLFYGKELGSYAPKLEKIFLLINKAQQMLSNKNKRAEYDKQLGPAAPPPAAASSSPRAVSVARQDADGGEADARKREMAFTMLVRRGEKHEGLGEFEEAANEYRKAFALKHDVLIAVRGSKLLMRVGKAEEALLLAKAAVKEHPDSAKPLIVLGDIYEELEEYKEALGCYERAYELEPESRAKTERRIEYLKNMLR